MDKVFKFGTYGVLLLVIILAIVIWIWIIDNKKYKRLII